VEIAAKGARPVVKKSSLAGTWRKCVEHRYLFLMLLPVLVYYLIFTYAPIFNPQTGGILMAFKQHNLTKPFAEWNWVGLKYFEMMWRRPDFWVAMRNTVTISFIRLLFEFPMPIILALLLNEVRRDRSKRFFQTVFTFPNFLSWVLVVGLMRDLLQIDGVINGIIKSLPNATPSTSLRMIRHSATTLCWCSPAFLKAPAGDPSSTLPVLLESTRHCMRRLQWMAPTAGS
jgi:putative aldouronate transport system permease protein